MPSPEPRQAFSRHEPLPYEPYIRLSALEAMWPDEAAPFARIAACCSLQAAELCCRLIDEAVDDDRACVPGQQRLSRLIEHLVHGLQATGRLLVGSRSVPLHPGDGTGTASPSPGFAALSRLSPDAIDHISRQLEAAVHGLTFRLGIEAQVADLRTCAGLPALQGAAVREQLPAMDYAGVVQPQAVWAMRETEPFGPEDHIFSTAHQITECWLRIVHGSLRQAQLDARMGEWAVAAESLHRACAIMSLAIEAGQLLDTMVLADYHPLRVQLRDGSGAQSRAARGVSTALHAAAEPLWTHLAAHDLGLAEVLAQPSGHAELHAFLQGLKAMARGYQKFLFGHYLLALSVLGTNSLGSLGYAMGKLAERAVAPVFPRIDEAHHDFVMMTNLQYADTSGRIILRNELQLGWNPYVVVPREAECPRAVMAERVAAYYRCIEERNPDEWVRLFEPERGFLEDVQGTRPYLGAARLRVFIGGMHNAFSSMKCSVSPLRYDGSSASVDWRFDTVSYHGRAARFEGREDFVFGPQGQILAAVSHWQPADVVAQWATAERRERPTDALPQPPGDAPLHGVPLQLPAGLEFAALRAVARPGTPATSPGLEA